MPHLPPDPDTTVRDELAAMRRLAAAYDLLDALDDTAHLRVLRWAADRFHPGREELLPWPDGTPAT